jgi:hypothetical protein
MLLLVVASLNLSLHLSGSTAASSKYGWHIHFQLKWGIAPKLLVGLIIVVKSNLAAKMYRM